MNRRWKIIVWTSGVLFVSVCFYSALTEEMIPLYKAGNKEAFRAYAIGVPLCVLGTIITVYGGFLFAKYILFGMFNDAEVVKNLSYIQNFKHMQVKNRSKLREARLNNFKSFIRYSKRPMFWFFTGLLLIALGGILINYKTLFNV